MASYGYKIVWDGGANSVSVNGCPSAEEAYDRCVELALRCGWKAPKWWQSLGTGDSRPAKPLQRALVSCG